MSIREFLRFKWTMDADRVESENIGWDEMYKQQIKPAVGISMLWVFGLSYFDHGLSLRMIGLGSLFIGYLWLPAIGSWHYWQEEQEQ